MPFENSPLLDQDPAALSMDIDRPILTAQPTYPDHVLRGLDARDLVEIMERDCDGVPINVIEECSRRGVEMEALLAPLLRGPPAIEEPAGRWWLRLHAINILGILPSASAAEALTKAMLWLDEVEDDDLSDWCAGYWPAWFRNKPDAVIEDLQKIIADRNLSIGTRIEALECVVAAAFRQGTQPLDSQLDAVAELIADTSEPADLRFLAGGLLLHFPRVRHKELLEQLVDQQTLGIHYFSAAQVGVRYDNADDELPWLRFGDPLKFYRTEEFQRRGQLMEADGIDDLFEDSLNFDEEAFDDHMPYVRDTPKTGRNDPCSCGSGKKYKKCCLRAES